MGLVLTGGGFEVLTGDLGATLFRTFVIPKVSDFLRACFGVRLVSMSRSISPSIRYMSSIMSSELVFGLKRGQGLRNVPSDNKQLIELTLVSVWELSLQEYT